MFIPNNPADFSEQWYRAHTEWARADEAARVAEEKTKIIEAELFNQAEGGSAEAKKQWVRSRQEYKKAVYAAIKERTTANLKLGERKKVEMSCDIWRTLESTKRAEMQLK